MENQTKTVAPIVGVEKAYVAKLLTDTKEGATWDTPRYLQGITEVGLKPKVNTESYYAENKEWAKESTIANIDGELSLADLTAEDECYIFGHKKDANGGVIYKDTDVAPQIALIIKANLYGGAYRYLVFYNGQFVISDEDYKGKQGKANFQGKKTKAGFMPLHYNGQWKYKIDSTDGMTDEVFFGSVQGLDAEDPVKLEK